MSRLVLFVFAGREVNMRIQMPYLTRILDDHPDAELHLWDLTRTAADQRYVRGLDGAQAGRVHVLGHLHTGFPMRCLYPGGAARPRGWRRCTCVIHKPPYEKPYQFYAEKFLGDTVFVKIDDDVLFLETDRFDDLIAPLVEYPDRIISANVINNAVCAKYEPELVKMIAGDEYDPRDPKFDRFWWNLHTAAGFAQLSHGWFLNSTASTLDFGEGYVRTRPGEAISINCIAFTHRTMVRLASMMSDRLGDEGAVDRCLPWIARSFHAAHLTFGPQDKSMSDQELAGLREQYAKLSKEYLP